MTFRTRSFLAALATAAVTLLVATTLVSWSVRRTIAARVEQGLVEQAKLAAETLSHRRAATPAELDAEADALGALVSARVTFVGPDGAVVGDSELTAEELRIVENHADRPEVGQALAQGVGLARRHSATVDTDMLYVAVPVRNPDAPLLSLVRLALPLREEREQMTALGRSAAAGAVAGLLTALLLAWTASRLLTRRLASVATAARRTAEGEPARPPRDYGNDEIGAVARALDQSVQTMAARAAELATDRARMAAILAGMREGVLVANRDGRVLLLNAAARTMLRLGAAGEGRHYLEVVRQPDIAAHIGDALRGGTREGHELQLEDELVVVLRSAPVAAAGETGAVLVLQDITELRRTDRIRRDFVANVSHELRTPLTAVRGYVEALLDAEIEWDDRRFLEIALRHTLRMERLVRDLLRLARLDARQDPPERTTTRIDELVAGAETELATHLAARRQEVVRRIAPDADTVYADAGMLQDALRNLLENASNYSPEGSTITVSANRQGERTILTVTDEGRGIPEADLTRVFERFYRVDKSRARGERHTGGTGLGLAIVKHIVELHGGRVSARNGPAGGAVFTIDLPGRAAA